MTATPLLSFDLDRTYAAPPKRVWAAWTRAELLQRWACPDPVWLVSTCEVDARAGGGYRLRFGPRPAGEAYDETATFAVFESVERLVLDVLAAGDDMAETSRCTMLLLPVEGYTRLELTVEGLSGALTAEHNAWAGSGAWRASPSTSTPRPDRLLEGERPRRRRRGAGARVRIAAPTLAECPQGPVTAPTLPPAHPPTRSAISRAGGAL